MRAQLAALEASAPVTLTRDQADAILAYAVEWREGLAVAAGDVEAQRWLLDTLRIRGRITRAEHGGGVKFGRKYRLTTA